MPTIKSIFRIVVAFALLGGYYLGPFILKEPTSSPLGLKIDQVNRLTIENLADGKRDIVKNAAGEWIYETGDGRPDATLIDNFLINLAHCRWEPASSSPPSKNTIGVILKTDSGEEAQIALGPRSKPFAGQIVTVNGRSHKIDRDLSACLNVWDRLQPMDSGAISDPIVYDVDPGKITMVEYDSICADYLYEKAGGKWRLAKPSDGLVVDQTDMNDYLKGLAWLSGVATSSDVMTKDLRNARWDGVRFQAGDDVFSFRVSPPFGKKYRSLVEMLKPERTLLTISSSDRQRLLPSPSALIRNLPEIKIETERLKSVSVRRAGSRDYVLTKHGDSWRFAKPSISIPMLKIEAEPGMKPMTKADEMVLNLSHLRSRGAFDPTSSTRRRLLNAAFAAPAAMVKARLSDGRTLVYKISKSPKGSDIRLISVGKKLLVSSDSALDRLAPKLESYFAPNALKGSSP